MEVNFGFVFDEPTTRQPEPYFARRNAGGNRGGRQKADPACEPFIGVIVERTKGSSLLEANWAVKGIKFGRADRNKAGNAVNRVVERMQRDFNLSNGRSGQDEG